VRSLALALLRSGPLLGRHVIAVVSSSNSRIIVLSCNHVLMESTLVAVALESNHVGLLCYFFEISAARHARTEVQMQARQWLLMWRDRSSDPPGW
jgi:hypothetical protein